MPFVGILARTTQGIHPMILYRSIKFPDRGFKFQRKNDKRYTCHGCSDTKKKLEVAGVPNDLLPSVPLIRVHGNTFLDDPDEHPHCCQPYYSVYQLFGEQVLREVGEEVRGSEISSNEAKKILRKRLADKSGKEYDIVQAHMPSKRAITQFAQRKSKKKGAAVQQSNSQEIHPDIAKVLVEFESKINEAAQSMLQILHQINSKTSHESILNCNPTDNSTSIFDPAHFNSSLPFSTLPDQSSKPPPKSSSS